MAYRTEAVANAFLEKAWLRGETLTPMKLQMLVYFAQGWHLAIREKPFIDEQIEATEYGLVIPSLLDCFEEYDNRPIDSKITDLVSTPAKDGTADDPFAYAVVAPTIEGNSEDDTFARSLIERVWDQYGRYTAIQLFNMARLPGSPWRETSEIYDSKPPRGTDIPMQLIQDYFVDLARRVPRQAATRG